MMWLEDHEFSKAFYFNVIGLTTIGWLRFVDLSKLLLALHFEPISYSSSLYQRLKRQDTETLLQKLLKEELFSLFLVSIV